MSQRRTTWWMLAGGLWALVGLAGCTPQEAPSASALADEAEPADTSGVANEDPWAPWNPPTEPDPDAIEAPERFDAAVELASEISPSAPTTVGIVTWSFDEGAAIEQGFIRFGLTTEYGFSAPVNPDAVDLRTLLLGMKPASRYHFQLVATVGGLQYLSGDYTVTTGEPFADLDVDVVREPGSEPGFLVVSDWAVGPQAAGNRGMVYILDSDGEVVWWVDSQIGSNQGSSKTCAARVSADGHSMWMVTSDNGGGAMARVSLDTLEREAFNDLEASHDLVAVERDCVAYIEYDDNHDNRILEICKGETVPRLVSHLYQQGGTGHHLNALRYKADEDLFVVSDNTNDVYGVERSTGNVLWALSDVATAEWGPRQHGVHLLDDSILVFANDGAAGGDNNAILEFDRTTGAELLRYEAAINANFLGDVQRLPGGNTLVSFSGRNTILEIDPHGNVVMEMEGVNPGYGFWRPTLYGPPPAQ